MKVRDSGMPDEAMWSGFFNPTEVLSAFGLDYGIGDVVEFGCGYGTFTLSAAELISGTVHALDIEPEMVAAVQEKCLTRGIANVHAEVRDFIADGAGVTAASQDAALLFNILHHEEPVALMGEACRILKPGAVMAVIHWNHDPSTPRGPALDIRPRPEQCIAWAEMAGFAADTVIPFDFPPYHYGLLFRKPGKTPRKLIK